MRLAVYLLVAGVAVAAVWWLTHRKNEETEMKQDIITRALAVIAGLTSASQGFATALAAQRATFQAEVDDLKAKLAGREDVDLTGLQSALDKAEAAEADLARAAVVNTAASDEVHVDNGGTGTAPATEDGGTVVEPTAVPVDQPAAGDDATQQQGGGTGGVQA